LEITDQLLYNFPSDFYGYYLKGVCFYALEGYEASIKYYLACLKINPVFAKAYFNMGVSYHMIEKKDLALINIGKALILFAKANDQEKKLRCINALRTIGGADIDI
jgi:tetratricopeptide (TPR) repeat protein